MTSQENRQYSCKYKIWGWQNDIIESVDEKKKETFHNALSSAYNDIAFERSRL